jgi:hypothetical protein
MGLHIPSDPGRVDQDQPDTTRADPDRIELFRLSDDPRDVFYVPKKVGANVTLSYLRDVNRRGETAALGALLERMLGAEALDALCSYEDLTDEEMEAIGKAVQKHVLGSGPLAGNRASRRRS